MNMNKENFFVGMQVHAHDVYDEGAEVVLQNMREMAGVNTILVCANYVYEQMNHSGQGILPHNPKRKSYFTLGGIYFDPHPEFYTNTSIIPQKTPEKVVHDFDVLRTVGEAAIKQKISFYPWVSTLNHPFETRLFPEGLVIDVYGRVYIEDLVVAGNLNKVAEWFCPNNPEVRKFVLDLYLDIISNYPVSGVFVDRIRYPSESLSSLGVCFCEYCIRKMKDQGLDPERIKDTVKKILEEENQSMRYSLALNLGTGREVMRLMSEFPDLIHWIRFKINNITELIALIYRLVKGKNPALKLGLDLVPASGSWCFGQDFSQLSIYCDWLKPMTYNKGLGFWKGPFISIPWLQELAKLWGQSDEYVYGKIKAYLASTADLHLPENLDDFKKNGMPNAWVGDETKFTISLLKNKVPVYTGIQAWPPATPDDVKEIVNYAIGAGADGIISYCYGWSSFDHLYALKEALAIHKLI